MISLKRYLDASYLRSADPENDACPAAESLLKAYRAALEQFGDSGNEVCPACGKELKRGIMQIDAAIGDQPSPQRIAAAEKALGDLLQDWGQKAARHYQQKAGDVKDLLLIMARTAESLGHKDERFTHILDSLTNKLETIACLDDVSKIRSTAEQGARDLKESVARMSAETKVVIDHLRAEVATYQTKLEKAEYIASCDSLTGLGSRAWIEGRIQERLDTGSLFTILMIDIDDFRSVNNVHGNMVGDQLLKEFARELRSCCRFADLVARWSGDRFIVVLDTTGGEASSQATRLRAWISKPYHVPGRTGYVNIRMDATISLAESAEGDCLHDLLERGDAQLTQQRSQLQPRRSA
jgi:diguanylate cyclase (GGDEF)-like protein